MTAKVPREKLREVLRDACASIRKDDQGIVKLEEVGVILRHMGYFLHEAELMDIIATDLQPHALGGKDVAYDVFEAAVLRLLKEQEHPADEESVVIDAFRALDPEARGFVEVERMKELLTAGHTGFREKELNEFLEFARDHDEPEKVYYEDYAFKLNKFVQAHMNKHYNADSMHARNT